MKMQAKTIAKVFGKSMLKTSKRKRPQKTKRTPRARANNKVT